MPETGAIETDQSSKVEWKIARFCDLPKGVGFKLESPRFAFANAKWYLILYPNGQERCSDWISLLLCKEASPSPLHVTFKLGIQKTNGSLLEPSVYWIDCEFESSGARYGGPKLMEKYEFQRRKFDLAPDGTLRIFCSMSVDDGELARLTSSESSSVSELNEYKKKAKELEEKLSLAFIEKEEAVVYARNELLRGVEYDFDAYNQKIKLLEEKLSETEKEKADIACRIQDVNNDSILKELDGYKERVKQLEVQMSIVWAEKEEAISNAKNILREVEEQFDRYKRKITVLEEKLATAEKEKEAIAYNMDKVQDVNYGSFMLQLNGYKKKVKELEIQLSLSWAEKEEAVANARNNTLQEVEHELNGYRRKIKLLEEKSSTTLEEKETTAAVHRRQHAKRDKMESVVGAWCFLAVLVFAFLIWLWKKI